ncbi:MAG: tyrosine-type recombinase/integrase [Candidatus Kerfeldbacteria bacterium]|nr:tyrosine-type recombinase/integrase [Candidatus Kerfeldbacteria bacterium]
METNKLKVSDHSQTDLQRWVRRFLTYLVIERGASELTKRNYEHYLTSFVAYAKLSRPADITLDDIRDFRLYLNQHDNRRGEHLKKSTQNYYLIALRSFLKYLAKNDVDTLAPEKIELAKTTERQVSFLEGDDLERFLNAPSATKELPIIKARDKAILELLFSTGLRVSELARLKRDDINLNKDEFTVRGKGGKLRVVFLSNQARHFVKQYLDQRRDDHPAMFIRHDRAAKRSAAISALTPRSIQRLVTTYAK